MDDQDEISSHREELRHERLAEEEVEVEIDSLFTGQRIESSGERYSCCWPSSRAAVSSYITTCIP